MVLHLLPTSRLSARGRGIVRRRPSMASLCHPLAVCKSDAIFSRLEWFENTLFLALDLGEDDFSWIGMMVAGHQTETTTHGLGETGAGPPREAIGGPHREMMTLGLVAGPHREIVAGLLTDGPQAEIVIGPLTDGLLTGAAPAQSGQEMGETSHQVALQHETRISSGWGGTQGNGWRGRAALA
jgi:hypothetical protein